MRRADTLLLAILVAAPAFAGVREVELRLPVRAKLAVAGQERVYVGPFLRESQGDEGGPRLSFDVAGEFERYLRRLLRKETRFALVPAIEGVRPASSDPLTVANDSEFWRELGGRTQADFIVAGSIDFQVQDRSGYKTEEYVSPIDGRTYYRQVLVEQTGFAYDILLNIYDGRTGKMVLQEPLKDFQERPERNFDEFTGMFANLYAMENRLIGVFVPRTIKSKRLLFTP
jgi:hypothetical protein